MCSRPPSIGKPTYARAATNLNVWGYLLKHEMDREKMNALLRSVHEEISRSRVRDSYSAKAALFGLFKELMAEGGQIQRRQDYELQFPGRYSLLLLAQDCVYPALRSCFGASEGTVPEQEVQRIFREMSARPLAFVNQSPQRLIVLLDGGTPAASFAAEAREALARCGCSFQAWIIAEQEPIMRCAERFQQTAFIRDMGVFYPRNYLMYADFVAPPVPVEAPAPFDALDRCLREKDNREFLAQLDRAFLHAIECKDPSHFGLLVDYCCGKLADYDRKVVNVHTGETFHALDEGAQENWYDADRIHQWLRERFSELFRLFSHSIAGGYSEMTRAAIDYINRHYGDENLYLDNMAERLGISSGRLNVLFKQETGQTLWQLIIRVRMVMLPDVLHQFQDLVNLGISDYMICAGREVLYSNLGDDTHIVLAECPDEMFAPIQYQVNHFESDDRTVFSALCTYIEEDLRIFVSVSREDIVAPYARVFQSFRLLLILISAILLAAFWITLQHALRRLNRLEKEMNRVQLGDYDIHISDNSGDEISGLTHSLHIMLDKIKCDMKENERMQYALLVSAIDPHYLYNTLNTVTALAELGKTQEAAAVNNALIGTLKDRLRMKNYKIFDTVRAEMDALDNYMLIQNYLSFVKIDYSFHVAAGDENLMIPKNIIQPLVENSIKHGILCKDFAPDEVKRGRIAVALCRSDAGISITVEDDGVGMDEATLEKYFVADNRKRWQKENVEHIGILNALMRLDYLYGGNYGVTARNRESGGLFIAQQLPLEAKL